MATKQPKPNKYDFTPAQVASLRKGGFNMGMGTGTSKKTKTTKKGK